MQLQKKGVNVDIEYVKQNRKLLNHALQIFGIDYVADQINLFNSRYVINQPIISIGTGIGLLEAYVFNTRNISFYGIELTTNPY